jgi:LacI family transcriptional regulator
VPDQVAVVGVDNDEMVCSLTNPPLTSVIQGTDMLGFYAAEILDRMINGEDMIESKVIPPQSIAVRESSDSHVIEDELIFKALGFIRDRACSGIRVDEVAHHCHVSRSTLENRFKRKLGKSVHNEITRLQINKVKDLLIHDGMPLKHISRITGFSSPQYMSIKLKEDTGLSPMQYRLKHRSLV